MGDLRWRQRYQNYTKAFQTLREAVFEAFAQLAKTFADLLTKEGS